MAYPDGIDNGLCPPSHPHHLISIFYEVWFSVKPFNALNDGGRFVLSNGDPTGYGLHGDFMNGWDHDVLSRAVATCTAMSGVIEDCPVFQNEGRFYTDDQLNACSAPNPLPAEHVDPGNLLPNLPGCIAVTEGPAPATAADLVPGCVPGGGNGSAVPLSGSPSTNSSTAPAKNTSATASSSHTSSSASGTSAPHANQLGALTTMIPASTFTTDLSAVLDILQGGSTVSTSAASSTASTWPTNVGNNNGIGNQCGKAAMSNYRRRENADSFSAHRRSRMQRRHGSLQSK